MQKAIGSTYPWLPWQEKDPRYMRLAELDRLLDGEFYDHLDYPFSQENDNNRYIEMLRRRPSVQWNIYDMISRMCARKIFAGRHAPVLMHENDKIKLAMQGLSQEASLMHVMNEAVVWGSAGSVAITFRIIGFGEGKHKAVANVWRARDCWPKFNARKELELLRVQLVTGGGYFIENGTVLDYEGKEIDAAKRYWFVNDFTGDREVRYLPIPEVDWMPIERRSPKLRVDPGEQLPPHELGFVPAQWIINQSGGRFPDGQCTWKNAVKHVILVDYTMSQIGAGIWYNCSPQVVIKGQLLNMDGTVYRGASRFFQVERGIQDKEGVSLEPGSVELLEATGKALEVGVDIFIAELKKQALQQICASQKDPEKFTTAMSGRAAEILDAEFVDLFMEKRTIYGDDGYLGLLKKMAIAASKNGHVLLDGVEEKEIDGTTLYWPAMNPPSADEMQKLMTGAQSAVGEAGKHPPIFTPEEMKEYVAAQLDMPLESANRTYTDTMDATADTTQKESPDGSQEG